MFSLVLVGFDVPATSAQQPDTAHADSVDATPVYRLAPIEVTVTRTRSEWLRLPYAVEMVDIGQIQRLEATIALDESLLEIPGVFVDNRYNFALGNRISIRGFGARSQFGVRGIRVIQDGIPLTLPDGQSQLNNLDLAAAGRIEVIRGPASSLYGNASAGVISVQTEPPPPVALRPEIWLLGGRFDNGQFYGKYDMKAAGTLDRADYVAHLGIFRTDGYRLHSEARYALVNSRVRYRPDSDSELTLVLNYAIAPQADNPSSLPDSLAHAVPDTARDIALAPGRCPADPGFGGCQDLGEESTQGQMGLTYRRRLGGDHEILLMGYGLFRTLDNRIPFTLIELDRRAGGARLEYRYAPPNGRLTALTIGVDIDQQRDDRREFFRDDAGIGELSLDQLERVTALGLFAYAGLELAPRLPLSASARYDRVRFAADDRLVAPADGDPDDSGSRTLVQLSPMVGLSYLHRPWLHLYANVGRSFLTPTTTELTDTAGGFNRDLDPERALSYEIGAKGTLAGRISYSAAAFYADVTDQIIGFESAATGRTLFRNAGSSDHRGFELGARLLLSRHLSTSIAYTYSDFRFDQFATAAGDFAGKAIPGLPPHQLHLQLRYEAAGRLSAALRLSAADRYFADNANIATNDGYLRADLRVALPMRVAELQIEPLIGVNNLFDARYNSSVVVNAAGGNFFEPAPGRNLYAGLRLRGRP